MSLSFTSTGLVLSFAALATLAGSGAGPQGGTPGVVPAPRTAPSAPVTGTLETPTGVDIPGEQLPSSAFGPSVIEAWDAVLAREARRVEPDLNPKLRNGSQGSWEIPSRRRSDFPRSGEHYATARWGDTSMGIGFGEEVDLRGVWVAGQATPQVWAPAVRAVGYRGGAMVATTAWFDDVDDTPSWLAIDFARVDRVVFEARAAHEGAGYYGIDDLTFDRGGQAVVIDFDDLDYRAPLSGSGYAGLTWELGTGDFAQTSAVHAPVVPAQHVEPSGPDNSELGASASPLVATLPSLTVDFAGPDQSDPGAGWIPPDTHGAIGPNHFVSVVNQHLSVYDKGTTARVMSVSLNSFFGGGGAVSKGDPRVLYDHHSDRWVIIATDFASGIHFAWSTSNDPTGSWFKTFIVLALGADAGTWPDYPLLGLDANGIYVGAFMVGNSMSLFAIDKAPLMQLVPTIGTVTAWRSLLWEGALQPCLTYGTPFGCYVTSRFSTNMQRIRRINPPLTSPTLTQLGFVSTKNGQTPPSAPALGSSVNLDTVDARHMNAVYRNGSVWMTHCVDKAGRSAINWYEIDPGGLSVVQEGTIKSATDFYHFPSIAVNSAGDVVVGFSASSPTMYAGSWYTGRMASDPPGEMAIPVEYKTGGGPYNQVSNGLNRWGDYSMSTVDPDDDLTFWTIQEHAKNNGSWGTRIAQLQFAGCAPPSATQPADATRCPGTGVTFSTTAGGTGPFTYQWQMNAADISGATSSSYTIASVTAGDAGSYACVVTDVCGSTTSAAGVLTVDTPVSASDPAGATECTGNPVGFSTTAGGTGPFTYQWRKDGADIGGATASSYDIASLVSADAGDYDVVVTGACGSVTTAAATLVVDDAVTATDPVGTTECEGAAVAFSTTAGGTGPLSYQWRKDGADISGATASAYNIAAVVSADAGDYDVVVTGACGSVTTAAATLVVDDTVSATDPVSVNACDGSSAVFSTTAGGAGPFAYQWRKDGLDIGGATASSYTIAALVSADAGDYDVVVTGACGAVTTAAATLVVDDAVTATDPAGATACEGAGASFSTTAGGTGPFAYQWRKDGLDIGGATASSYTIAALVSADAGDYDVVVTGACGAVTTAAATLVVDDAVTATDPAGATACEGAGASFSTTAGGTGPFAYQWRKDGLDIGGATASAYTIAALVSADAGDYDVVVTGACGAVTTAAATLVVDDAVTATDPAGATACEGAGASFSTTAGGTGPFAYQWRKDGLDIGGATASSYTIAALVSADAGDYDVVVTGACGSVTTAAATLVVDDAVTATDPAGATACEGAGASFSTTAGGTGPFAYQWRKDGLDIGGATASSYTIAALVSADAGDYDVVVTGACGAATTAAATLVVDDAVTATDPAAQMVCAGAGATFDTIAGGTGPLSFQWKKDGSAIGGATASSYTIALVSSADAGSYSVEVTGACGTIETAAAALTVLSPTSASDPLGASECAGASVTFDTVASGSGPFSYQWKKDGTAIGGATLSAYTIASVAAADTGDYSVEVTGACGTIETAAATLTVGDDTTASDPLDAAGCVGAGVSFDTVAGGTGPFTYQWKKDGAAIGGATASSYAIAALSSVDAGDYSVEVTGACGQVETAAATLTVDDAVTASDPLDATVCPAVPVTFDTTAGGTGPFTYQWKKDGAAIPGAVAAAYTIPLVASADAGDYSVEVTGACGTVESAAAKLTVGVVFTSYCTAGTSAGGCQATLSGTGTPSASQPSGFVVVATGVEAQKDGLFFFGKNGRQANPWGNGTSYQCVVPPVRRGGLLSGTGTSGQCDGLFGQDLNARWQAKPNHNPGAGATVQVQLWYRDPSSTSNQSTSLSDALEFPVCP